MEGNNNSKQVVLSIVGIAILVIAVVGVTFAFFTYSRTGESNNIITTGSITFSVDEGEENPTIDGTNAFPMSDTEGAGSLDIAEFSVTGSLPAGASPVTYYVYAIAGEKPSGNPPAQTEADAGTPRTWKRFKSNQIKIMLTATGATVAGSGGGTGEIVYENNYDKGALAGQLYTTQDDSGKSLSEFTDTEDTGYSKDGVHEESGALADGFTLAHGTLPAGSQIDHKYTLRMWINGGTDGKTGVTISDTDYSKDFRASDTGKGDSPLAHSELDSTSLPDGKEADDRLVFSDMYFSIKIKVVASDDPNAFVKP